MFFEYLSEQEAARMEIVLAELESEPAARHLVQLVRDRGGICQGASPELFEARVAHELMCLNTDFVYEFAAGVGITTVDFLIDGAVPVLLEVASLRDSTGVRNAYHRAGAYTSFQLTSRNLNDPHREMQSIEAELVVLQGKLGKKVFASGRPAKFPEPQNGRYNVIMMDVRRLFGGGEDMQALFSELKLACYGYSDIDYVSGRQVRIGAGVPDASGGIQRLLGVFEDVDHPIAASGWLRSRIHAIHFVCETRYEGGELSGVGSPTSIGIMTNPHLVSSRDEVRAFMQAYPLVRAS